MPKHKSSSRRATNGSPGGASNSAEEADLSPQDDHHHPYCRDRIVVHDHDVLNGRGVNMAHHPGNERFRALIQSRSDPSYCASYSLNEKKALAEEVVRHIEALDPPGRFLKRIGKTKNKRGLQGPWEIMAREEAVKKARQALRDCNRPDRVGYAKSVPVPVDVRESSFVRKNTGLSQQQYAQQLAAVTTSTEDGNPTSQGDSFARSHTPNSEISTKGTPVHSPIPSPIQSRKHNSQQQGAIEGTWMPCFPVISAETRDVNESLDNSQDTPNLMSNATPTTSAPSSGFFSDIGDFSYRHTHDVVDVSHAPAIDSPTHFSHILSGSPGVHGTFEEALASIQTGEDDDDDKPHAVSSFSKSAEDLLQEEAEAAFDGAEEFVAAFEGDEQMI